MKYTQTIPADGVLNFASAGRLFLIDSLSGANVDVEVLRSGGAFFIAPGVAKGFRIFTAQAFEGVRITGAPGESVSFFIANEDVQISTISGAAVAVPGGVAITNTNANPVPVNAIGATFTAANVGIKSPSSLVGMADVAIAAGASALIAAADAVNTEREVIVKNLFANATVVRIAGATVAANVGHELQPGESVIINTMGAVYAYCAAAQSVSVVINSRP